MARTRPTSLTLDYSCAKLALLFVSKREDPGPHYNITERLKSAVVENNVLDTLAQLDKERAKRKFKISRPNFYWIKKELTFILDAPKNMQEAYAKNLEFAIKQTIEMFLNDFDGHTKAQKKD